MQIEDVVVEIEAVPKHSHHDYNKIAFEQAMSATEINSKLYKLRTYDKAINKPIYGRCKKKAIEDEMENLENYYTWEYDNLPSRKKVMRSKCVFKVKYHSDGTVTQYKARLVAQSFSQIYQIDFNETFSPTVRRELLRIFLAIS